MTKRHIIAMGGGSMEPDNLMLDEYVLSQTDAARPKVCFLPTASGDADGYILNFYKAFSALDCRPSYLSLFRLPTMDLEDYLLEKHIIYVGGGNTRSMLALWREWGLDTLLEKAYQEGVVLAGLSAGANCWFEQCSTDSVPGELRALPGLGFLPGSFCSHYDGEADRRTSLRRLLLGGDLGAGYAADDGAAVHFVDEQLRCAVSSRPKAAVYRVENANGRIMEEPLDMYYLGGRIDNQSSNPPVQLLETNR